MTSGATGSVTISGGWFNGADYIVDVGTPNHIIGSPPIAPTSYSAGQGYTILVKNRNTGPVDINVNSLGAVPMKLPGNLDLSPGDIMPNMLIRVWYDGTSFKMLSPIYMERIDTAIAWIVGPNAGADFTDLNAALFWLSRRRIDQNGTVAFNLQGATSGPALIHTYNANIIIEHPDGDRLTIAGPAPAFVPNGNSFTATGYTAAPINADTNSNIGMLRTAFRAEIRITGNFGMSCRGRIGLLTNFMVTGSQTFPGGGANQNLIGIAAGAVNINCVAACNSSGCNWYIDINSALTGSNFYAVGSQLFAVGLAHSANLVISGGAFVIAGAYVDGIQAAHGAIIQVSLSGDRPRLYSLGQCGINHWGCSSVHCQLISGLYIGWYGVKSVGGANAWVYGSQFSYLSITAYYVGQNGNMDCDTCYGAAIGGSVYAATVGGIMYAAAPQGTASFSPAPNTFGNSAAYITA